MSDGNYRPSTRGENPSFESVDIEQLSHKFPGGGSRTLEPLERHVDTDTGTALDHDFTGLGGYDAYLVEFVVALQSGVQRALYARFNDDSTANYDYTDSSDSRTSGASEAQLTVITTGAHTYGSVYIQPSDTISGSGNNNIFYRSTGMKAVGGVHDMSGQLAKDVGSLSSARLYVEGSVNSTGKLDLYGVTL